MPVQVRLPIALTSEQYIRQQAWRTASLASCPFGRAPCGAVGHGSYERVRPAGLRIRRYWCASPCQVTIGLIPDFASSGWSGTLDAFEEAAATAEVSPSLWAAANAVRPDEGVLASAIRWIRLRVRRVDELLRAAVGLVRELLGCAPTLCAVRERLGLEHGVLGKLRELCGAHLESLAAPVGLVPRPLAVDQRRRRDPQGSGPDPPSEGA